MRALKFLLALVLLPVLLGAMLATARIGALAVRRAGDGISLDLAAFGAGLFLAVLSFVSLPRPRLGYVVGHELTHGLVALLFGVRIHGLRAGARGGSIRLSRTNVAIALAPYILPLYALAAAGLYAGASLFVDLTAWRPVAVGVIAFGWGLHLLFTVQVFRPDQPDLRDHGFVFSAVVILLGNLVLVSVAAAWLGAVSWGDVATAWQRGVGEVAAGLAGRVHRTGQ